MSEANGQQEPVAETKESEKVVTEEPAQIPTKVSDETETKEPDAITQREENVVPEKPDEVQTVEPNVEDSANLELKESNLSTSDEKESENTENTNGKEDTNENDEKKDEKPKNTDETPMECETTEPAETVKDDQRAQQEEKLTTAEETQNESEKEKENVTEKENEDDAEKKKDDVPEQDDDKMQTDEKPEQKSDVEMEKSQEEKSGDTERDEDITEEPKEKRGRGRPPLEKRAGVTPPIETRQKSKRPRRHISAVAPQYDFEVVASPVSSPGTGRPGRPRKNLSPSPAVIKQKKPEPPAPESGVLGTPYYVKGEVLAVRNEDGGFYLCICPNNIFTISKPFKVQWLDKCGDKNIFKRSYFDYLHFKSVLYSGVVLNKIEKDQLELLPSQEKKILHRLEKSLRGEEDISSDSEDESSSDGKKMTNLKRAAKQKEAADSVDSSEEVPLSSISSKGSATKGHKRKSSKDADISRKLGKIQIPGMHTTGIKRKSQKYELGISSPAARLTSPKTTPVKGGASGSTTGRPRGRPPKNQNINKESGAQIMSSDSDGAVRYMINPEVAQQMQPKPHRSNENLIPNQAIDVAAKDPAFDLRQSESHLPKDKLAIRAAILQDVGELESIFASCTDMNKLLGKTRSVDVPLTAFHYALRAGNAGVLRSLVGELSKLPDLNPNLGTDPPAMLRDASDAQNGFKGEELSPLDISKGMKEGNHAFLKDTKVVFESEQALASDIAHFACSSGVSPNMLQLLMDAFPKFKEVDMKEMLFDHMYRALEMGHVETAQFLIRASRQESITSTSPAFGAASGSPSTGTTGGSHGMTELHELVLCSDEPVPAAFTVKDAKKKSGDSHRLQPVHCAACNPNATCLKQLISAAKECLNTMDGRNRRPIHYAAACSTTEPLEFLKNKVSIEEQDVNGMTPLMIAAEAGRDRNVDVLLRTAASSKVLHVVNVVERPDRSNKSAVHYAALNGHAKVIEILARYKADLNKCLSISKARATPLMLAAANGHTQTCISLVECGASIEITDKLQRTALIHAAMNGHYPVITYLLRKGADPNVADSSNNTAIHYAAAYGWYHCVNVLLQATANPDVYNDRKMSPIGVALLKDHRETAHLLSEHHADANFRDDRGRTLVARLLAEEPLTWKLVDHVTYLLEAYKPEVNAQDVLGMAPIHNLASNSVRMGKGKTVNADSQKVSMFLAEMLLDRGAELNMADYRGRLPLYFAVEDMNVALIELFVRRGTHCPRSTNSTADNVLHMLSRNWEQGNMADIVFGLVNMTSQTVQELAVKRNKYGFTPLQLLTKAIADHPKPASSESLESTEAEYKKLHKKLEDLACPLLEALVLAAKSDVSAAVGKTRRNYRNPNDDGKTAAHYLSKAVSDKECKVLACLLRHKPKLDILDQQGASPLITALINRNCRAVQMLLDVAALPNFCSNNKKNKYPAAPLILAVARHGPGDKSLLPAIRALLRTISDIKLVPPDPRNGRTALMYAVEKEEELDLVNALLEKQASLSETDSDGHAPLHLAVNASGPSSALFDIPDLLIEKGASLTVADKFGRIPLHYAYTKITKESGNADLGCDPIELTTLLTSGMSGAEVDTADATGRTPLHEAARRGAMICCMHLVERGANINRQDSDCNTPLSLAVKAGHNSCAVMLIQKGANVNTNVITIPQKSSTEASSEVSAPKWRLKSAIIPPRKPTCEPVFKVVVEKGWQGVTYVMLDRLEACGVYYAAAVESAMRARKYQVVLSLLRKQRDSGKLGEKNDLKQNLLHVLAINKPTNTDVQIKVAKVLIERGVPSYTTDDHGCTPLHYAAFTKNLTLIKFFIERNPSSFRGMIALTDQAGRNAFAALLWNSVINDDVTVSILKLFLEHDRGSGAINRTCNFPVSGVEAVCQDVDPAVAVRDYFNGDVESKIINPLIRTIQLRAHRAMDLLLDYNIDINLQVEGLKNQTPLMLAVQLNDEYVVNKLLTHKTPVLLSSLDSDDRTVLHHAAKPLPYGYWENMGILRSLLDQGVPVQQVDKMNCTALSYALEGGSGRMSDELQSVSGIPPEKWEKPGRITAEISDGIAWASTVPEYEVDAVTILERIREDEMENDAEQPTPNPDILSGLRESGEIVYDPTVNRHCDVFLIAVDVQQSGQVQYNFFRMQVIHQKGKNLYMFFTRWGMIGERGNWQTSPFTTPANAIKEFAKYFKLKTANEWRSINSFKPQTRKYHLVAADVQRQKGVADLEFDLHTDIQSLLGKELQDVFSDLINVESMKEAMKDSTNVDPDVMPFGRLEKERLTHGIDILNDIKELISSTGDLKTSDPQDQIRLQRVLEKIQQRSTEYYRVLPPRGGIFDRIRPISDTSVLSTLMLQTKRLSELEFANKVLLGAQYRINEMNPFDYVYRSVGCQMKVMDPDSDESQYLLQCIHNAGSGIKVDCIYRVDRDGEAANIVSTGLGNYRMLWHGTNILNLMSILHKGLQTSEAPVNGNVPHFGKGIYLSDMAGRAMQDCKIWAGEKKYLILCQVALGHVKEIRDNVKGPDAEVANSVMAVGKYIPNPEKQLILPEGGAISLGEKTKNTDMTGVTNTYNEYVVYSPEQVCLRYLVRFEQSDDTSHSASASSK
uniref:Poly [ADP-ribose] polymerase n=1 Tax=Phallusia mammillata TaxID=59560 RepID=A0A6F9DBH5_9ASCI|nr:poly(ADP-ribose) polymerase pme-5 [Phallusia mammillata]